MSATAAVNRPPPAHPGPNGGNPHPRANSNRPPSRQQDPGLHCASQDPGPSSHPQHHVSARPVFYVQAPHPHPPPFLHYQWPMPFSYNPYTGFPGMGYGMVMPPFPPPYMEAPAYVLPHPQLQPVDYRRLLHPQVYAPSAPYQNPNQARRVHLPYMGPVRETVNSEVQTEPTRRGVGGYGEESPVLSTDSGGGTASNSPSPLSSASKKRGSAEVENYTLPGSNANDKLVKRTSTCSTVKGCIVLQPTGLKTVQAHFREALEKQQSHKDGVSQEKDPPCLDVRCNVWSVSSADGMVPVCSSSQQEEVVQDRLDSVADILMSWGGGTTLADKLPQNTLGTEVEHDQFVYQIPTETTKGPALADSVFANDADDNLSSRDSAALCKILKMRAAYEDRKAESKSETGSMGLVGSVGHCPPYRDELLSSLNSSDELRDNEQENGNETNPHEDNADITPYHMSLNSGQIKRNLNESVWSVESLAPYIPTKEWLLQNSMFEPQVIVERTEEAENGEQSTPDNQIVKAGERRQTHRYSSSDTDLMSDRWLMFSTPAEKGSPPKKQEMQSKIDASEMRRPEQAQNIGPSEKDSVASPTRLPPCKIVISPATEEDVDKNRSSEPEANQSPNQESLINEQQEKSPCSPKQEETLSLNSVAEGEISSTGQMILQNEVDMEDEAGGNKEVSQLKNQQLCVPMADQEMADMSPSKAHMVDCGVQCEKLQDCDCKDKDGHNSKCTDKKAIDGHAEEFSMRGRMQKNQKKNHYRNRGHGKASHREWMQPQPLSSDQQSSQQETYSGYYGETWETPKLEISGRPWIFYLRIQS